MVILILKESCENLTLLRVPPQCEAHSKALNKLELPAVITINVFVFMFPLGQRNFQLILMPCVKF